MIDIAKATDAFIDECEAANTKLFETVQRAHMGGASGPDCKDQYLCGCLTMAAFLYHQACINLEVDGMSEGAARDVAQTMFLKLVSHMRKHADVAVSLTKENSAVVIPLHPAGRA